MENKMNSNFIFNYFPVPIGNNLERLEIKLITEVKFYTLCSSIDPMPKSPKDFYERNIIETLTYKTTAYRHFNLIKDIIRAIDFLAKHNSLIIENLRFLDLEVVELGNNYMDLLFKNLNTGFLYIETFDCFQDDSFKLKDPNFYFNTAVENCTIEKPIKEFVLLLVDILNYNNGRT